MINANDILEFASKEHKRLEFDVLRITPSNLQANDWVILINPWGSNQFLGVDKVKTVEKGKAILISGRKIDQYGNLLGTSYAYSAISK